jgi:hypothetical protein
MLCFVNSVYDACSPTILYANQRYCELIGYSKVPPTIITFYYLYIIYLKLFIYIILIYLSIYLRRNCWAGVFLSRLSLRRTTDDCSARNILSTSNC